jgi:CheY-like chemotaxis protein
VLVCDDEPAVRGVLSESLRSLGCDVDAVGDGREALTKWASGRPYDLLVLDLLMPGMHGAEVFRELRQAHPTARVLIVSGHGGEVERNALVASGAAGFLNKPFTLARLTEAVRQALG